MRNQERDLFIGYAILVFLLVYLCVGCASYTDQVYELEQVQRAHAAMEGNEAFGKLVVRVRHPG